MRVTHRWLAAVAAVATIGLAGCSGGGSDGTSSSGAAPAMAPGGEKAGGAGPRQAEGQATDTAAKAPDLSVDQRSIIYRGSITLRVDNVRQQAARATAIVAGAGGFIGSDKRSSGDADDPGEATMELRVPAERFQSVVDQLAGLGVEEQRSVNTEDVTEEVLDLAARITSQQARVASGRRLLAQAKDLKDLVMLEGELASRESDLASLQAKQKRLTDLTALSTITVVLLDPAPPGAGRAAESGFLDGLGAGWEALVASLKVLLTIVGAVLPWLIALGLPAYGTVWLLRRMRRGRSPAAVPSAPAPAAPTAD